MKAKESELAVVGRPGKHPSFVDLLAFPTRKHDMSPSRDRLSTLRALLVLSMAMVESGDERQILQMAMATVPSLAPCWAEGAFHDRVWHPAARVPSPDLDASSIPALVADLPATGGPVELPGRGWAWAYSLRSPGGLTGYLLVACDEEPSTTEQFLLRSLAQQTAIAVANASLHRRERMKSEELAVAKKQLEESVAALQRGAEIHQRLERVAMAGAGYDGIAGALHELTGYPVAIEDRYGNLRAWAGPDRPDPYPKDPPARREQLLRRALENVHPFREGARLITIARPRDDVFALLALIDPRRTAGEQEVLALGHGATVLAMELARLQSLAETELRLRRDLVEELLAGIDTQSALRRAQVLGYDLERPHRVVLVEGQARNGDDNLFFHAVRRAARNLGVGTLLVSKGDGVIVLSDNDRPWRQFRETILAELTGGRCRVGVGGQCEDAADFPRSYHEAQLALKMQLVSHAADSVTVFDDLGVYRVLCEIPETTTMERFVRRWLGPLLDYDQRKGTGAELVATLIEYLERGGNYDATANALCVHRSTLKYRLQRIRDLGGYDLRDPDTYFNLQLATRAWHTLQALRLDDSSPDRRGHCGGNGRGTGASSG